VTPADSVSAQISKLQALREGYETQLVQNRAKCAELWVLEDRLERLINETNEEIEGLCVALGRVSEQDADFAAWVTGADDDVAD